MLRSVTLLLLLQVHHLSSFLHARSSVRTTNYRLYNRCNKNEINNIMADEDAAAVKGALENLLLLDHTCKDVDNDRIIISHAMIRALLLDPPVDDVINETSHQLRQSSWNETFPSTTALLCHQLRGLPKMPLYKEISHRLRIMQQYSEGHVLHEEALSCFLPASHFGLTEMSSLNELIPPPPSPMNIDECTKWFRHAGQDGVYAILGCRRTIGTIQKLPSSTSPSSSSYYLLPPTIPQLLDASRQHHKPHTQSTLTVAARALAKHAHRGEEQFFGILKGSEEQKNEHADRVIQRLIADAMWMNIHCFGGIDESNPVVEIRTHDGYGARWSGIWNNSDDAFLPVNVEFRGFLEPQVSVYYLKNLLFVTTYVLYLLPP